MPRGNPEDQVKGTNWSVTYWFDTKDSPPKASVDEYIERARQKGWILNGQIEKAPTTGNLHYQLHLNTKKQVRVSEIKKTLPTAFVQKARKKVALEQYVVKEDTRVAPLQDQSDKYPTANKLWELIFREYDHLHDKDGWEHDPEGGDLPDVRFYHDSDQRRLEKDPLAFFDKVMGRLIRRGYYVDMLASNPAIRSFWKKFWSDILYRTREAVRQTDRQNELISQHVTIPTIDDAASSADGSQSSSESAAAPGCAGDSDEEDSSQSSEGRDEGSSDETDADDDW